MQAKALYKSIYHFWGEATPLFGDCGELCNKACCVDDGDDESGMYLFPGEKGLFLHNPNFKIVKSEFQYGNTHADLLICKGPCDRDTRPLSCRIFPLIPYFRPDTGLKIIKDPRAKQLCPLLNREANAYLEPEFIQKTESVFKVLTQFSEIRCFLAALSDILDDEMKFYPKGEFLL